MAIPSGVPLSGINGGVPVAYNQATDTPVAVRTVDGVPIDELLTGIANAANLVAIGTGSAVSTGAGAGAGASASVGKDNAGVLSVSTAGTPAASSVVATIVVATPFPNGCSVVLYPANAAALAAHALYATGSQTGWTLNSGTSALTAGQTLLYNYIVVGF